MRAQRLKQSSRVSFGFQEEAVTKIIGHDEGILCAPTAFGKTAVAAWLIANRKVNTLVVVHRQQLLDQWQERLAMFSICRRSRSGIWRKNGPDRLCGCSGYSEPVRKDEVKSWFLIRPGDRR